VLVVLICLIAAITSETTRWHQLEKGYSFEDYISEFRKTYITEEYSIRKEIFESRLKTIKDHNKKNSNWKLGVNHMVDYTDAELKSMRGVKKQMIYHSRRAEAHVAAGPVLGNPSLPTSVDWRTKGVVSPVKDQGRCGSCWSFASAETIESLYAIATGQLVELSEQNILDCTPNPQHCGGSGGCEGATAELAFDMVAKHGIASEWTYPYTSYGGKDFKCNPSPVTYATISSYVTLPANQQDPLMNAVATIGPIAISVDASSWSFYESGVFDGCNQTQPDIDHAVQLVGYGTDPKLGDYWLVRNSWSPNWGETGYLRIRRETKPRCAVDITPADGTGCDGGPSQVTVCGTCGILYDSAYVKIH